ncbi:MAG: hypothetical protein HYS12_16035 [Planctomycetes bacterium]|nr:hypothetical protein [Planctomycetota bacterium]
MTSEWMADALMREWECQSLPRAKERANQATSAEAEAVPLADDKVAPDLSTDATSLSS